VAAVAEEKEPFRDLHWRPDGALLGAVLGTGPGRLVAARPGEPGLRALGPGGVSAFCGWDAKGGQLAYVAAEPVPGAKDSWAFLFVPEPLARQAVYVRKEGEAGPGRRVLGGVQVTFARWMPGEAKLSLWATYRPAYRSWPSLLLELGATPEDPLNGLRLRWGDPALVLDPAGGELAWKPIDGREAAQVGHYHLLRREFAEAWRWYEQAERDQPRPDGPADGPGADFFRYYCLEKLGRTTEAGQRLRRFQDTFLESYRAARKARGPAPSQQAALGAADFEPTDEQLRHWQDLYAAEVFLSLDAVEDGAAFFRRALGEAQGDAERLSKALVLSQFLLLRKEYREYADLATDTVFPLLLRSWKPRPANAPAGALTPPYALLTYGAGLSLVPLYASEFLAGLPARQVAGLLPRWRKARALADDDAKRLGVDLFLAAAHRRLGHADEARAADHRVESNPVRGELLGEGVAGLIQGLREAPAAVEQWRQLAAMFRG
jgi:hypothetical protein